MISTLLSVLLLSAPAEALPICLYYDLEFVDNGPEYYWTDNSVDRKARGVHIEVTDQAGTTPYVLQWKKDFPTAGVEAGCIDADVAGDFTITAKNVSTVNGITFHTYAYDGYDDPNPPYDWIDGTAWEHQPPQPTVWPANDALGYVDLTFPEGPRATAAAVTTLLFQRNHFNIGTGPDRNCCTTNANPDGSCGLGSSGAYTPLPADDVHIFVDTGTSDCPGGGGSPAWTGQANAVKYNTACSSKWLLGHELGHLVVGIRMGAKADASWLAPLEGCNGAYTNGQNLQDQGTSRSMLGKEYTALALREGWGDFVDAWLWNEAGGTDCVYRPREGNLHDYDLDLTIDNVARWDTADTDANQTKYGAMDCGSDGPYMNASWGAYWSDGFVGPETPDGQNWLRDVLDDTANACVSAGTRNGYDLDRNRSTLFDVVRMFWDLHSDTGSPIPVHKLADIFVDMCPRDWTAEGDAWTDTGQAEHAPLIRLKISAEHKYPALEQQIKDAANAHIR